MAIEVKVRCTGHMHKILFNRGKLTFFGHTRPDFEREENMVKLGGTMSRCGQIRHAWLHGDETIIKRNVPKDIAKFAIRKLQPFYRLVKAWRKHWPLPEVYRKIIQPGNYPPNSVERGKFLAEQIHEGLTSLAIPVEDIYQSAPSSLHTSFEIHIKQPAFGITLSMYEGHYRCYGGTVLVNDDLEKGFSLGKIIRQIHHRVVVYRYGWNHYAKLANKRTLFFITRANELSARLGISRPYPDNTVGMNIMPYAANSGSVIGEISTGLTVVWTGTVKDTATAEIIMRKLNKITSQIDHYRKFSKRSD